MTHIGAVGGELRVLAFLERYLEPEQTFIFRQMNGLPDCTVRFAARYRVPDGRYPDENVFFFGSSREPRRRGLRWKLLRLRQRFTGRYTWLGSAERSRLDAFLASFAPHVVHAHWGSDAMLIAPLCVARSVPLLVHFHGYDVSRLLADKAYVSGLDRLFRQMAIAITVSEQMRSLVITLGCPSDRVRCHYTGVPESCFAARTRAPDGKQPVFIQVGRLAAKKGHETSLEAFARLSAQKPGATLRIIGEGSLRSSLEERIAALGMGRCVTLIGRLRPEAVISEMSAADALLLPSHTAPDGDTEGLPNVAVEAMACGLPIIATRHGGIPEAVHYSEPDWLVAEGDVRGLQTRMERLTSDEALWFRLSEEGISTARRQFDLTTQNCRLRELYEEVIRRRP